MERIIQISPAWDKRDPNPGKNYGIGDCSLFMVLKGDLGAVSFTAFTNWYLPHVFIESLDYDRQARKSIRPKGAFLSYHSPLPLNDYEEDHPFHECEWIGGKCFGDGSDLQAEPVFDLLVREGSDAVWKYLEQYYVSIFKTLK